VFFFFLKYSAKYLVHRKHKRRRTNLSPNERQMIKSSQVSPGYIEFLEVIGVGSFAMVYHGLLNKKEVAVKVVKARDGADNLRDRLLNEAAIMLKLRHNNIVEYLGVCTEDPPNLFIVMEYLTGGSLHAILHNDDVEIEMEHVRRFALDTCKGMTYLHSQNIIHRDLKPHNLLVADDWSIKVSDFGLSRTLSDAAMTQTLTACGTPSWAAPEVLKEQRYSLKADVYSFGICLWEMCTRDKPYQNMTTPQVVIAVAIEGKRLTIPENIPTEMGYIISKCWQIDTKNRPIFTELVDSFEKMHMQKPLYEFPHCRSGNNSKQQVSSEKSRLLSEKLGFYWGSSKINPTNIF